MCKYLFCLPTLSRHALIDAFTDRFGNIFDVFPIQLPFCQRFEGNALDFFMHIETRLHRFAGFLLDSLVLIRFSHGQAPVI